VRIERVSELGDGVEILVVLDPADPVRTSAAPDLVSALRRLLPGITRHSCTSPASGLLASELNDTEIAHLFEHVVLELMVREGTDRATSGNTDWDFARDGRRTYRVTIGSDDRELAHRAAEQALGLMNALLSGRDVPELPR
jgi:hypothetical protein